MHPMWLSLGKGISFGLMQSLSVYNKLKLWDRVSSGILYGVEYIGVQKLTGKIKYPQPGQWWGELVDSRWSEHLFHVRIERVVWEAVVNGLEVVLQWWLKWFWDGSNWGRECQICTNMDCALSPALKYIHYIPVSLHAVPSVLSLSRRTYPLLFLPLDFRLQHFPIVSLTCCWGLWSFWGNGRTGGSLEIKQAGWLRSDNKTCHQLHRLSGFLDFLSQTQPSPEAIRRLAYEISDIKMADALKVKLLSSKAKLPAKGTSLAAGYDLTSAQQITIPVNGRALVQTDISISVPKGTYGRIAPRSGLAVKHGITTGAGVIDADYTGPIGIVLFNHGNQEFQIREGDRVAQLILEQIANKPVIEVQELTQTSWGDKRFGSTGSQQINIISRCKGNNKYSNSTPYRKEDNDGRGAQDEKENAYRKLLPPLQGQRNKEDTLKHHAPSPLSVSGPISPLPPELRSPRTRSAIANRIAPLPSIALVLDPEESPSAPENRAWNSSSESCLAPSSSLSHVRLLKSKKTDGGPDDDDVEEGETDSKLGRDSLDCTWETMGMEEESPCPFPNEVIGEIIRPPHPAQNTPSLTGAEARTDKLDKIPWENRCKGTQWHSIRWLNSSRSSSKRTDSSRYAMTKSSLMEEGGVGRTEGTFKASPKLANFKHKPRKGTPTWGPSWNWADDIVKMLVVEEGDERGEELIKQGIAMWRGMLRWGEWRGRMGGLILTLTPHNVIPWTLMTKTPHTLKHHRSYCFSHLLSKRSPSLRSPIVPATFLTQTMTPMTRK